MSGILYVTGTPIGNLGDFSPRAAETLKNADFIAAEDTRVTAKLLNHFGIKTPLVSYYEQNKAEKGPQIINKILAGENCAMVTDAGMPAISDPGEDLVRLAYQNGIKVESVPGPTAICTALAISGMNCRRFCFEGFLPANKNERRAALEQLVDERRTTVLYEAPHKLVAALKDIADILGNRNICIVKEITKIHESVIKGSAAELLEKYSAEPPKGEYVIIIEGAKEESRKFSLKDAADIAKNYIKDGMAPSAAAKGAAKLTGIKKGDIYKEIM